MARVKQATRRTSQAGSGAAPGGFIAYEEIARVAYELFEQRGYTHGNDQDDWFEAERIVRSRAASAPSRRGSPRA